MMMDMRSRVSITLIFFAIAAMVIVPGCGKRRSGDDRILAKVGNKTITLTDFNERISKLPPSYQGIVEKNRKRYLDEMILETLLYEDAIRNGLEWDDEVRVVLKEARKKILIAKLIKNEIEDNIRVPDSEARQYYEDHKGDFMSQPMWRASHILVSNEKEAQDILSELSRAANFEELARSRSIDGTASRGGDVGYFRTGQVVPEFEKACLELKAGQASGVIHTQFGYHIIKLTDKKESALESYEKVKPAIENELKKMKRSELFDELVLRLKEKYGVQIKEDAAKVFASRNTEKGEREEK